MLTQNKIIPKIYERSEECILVGYSLTLKDYQCWSRQCKWVIWSYNVVFIESQDATPSSPHCVQTDMSMGMCTHDTPWMQVNTTANTKDTGDELTNMEDQRSMGDPLDHK